MKILQINNCHYRRGGADVVYLNTIDLLKKNNHQVIEFSQKGDLTLNSEYSDYFVQEVNPFELSFLKKIIHLSRTLYSKAAAQQLDRLIKKEKPDIAHIHLYKGGLTAAILPILKKHKTPTCITLHSYEFLCPRNTLCDAENRICEKCIRGSKINCITKRCNRKNLLYSIVNYIEFIINTKVIKPENYFDKIISVSKFNYNKHAQKNNIKEKLDFLYNFNPGCETSEYNNERGMYYLYFGRLSEEKGLLTLINAFKNIKNAHLKIVGTGPLEKSLCETIATDNIKNIELLGYKTGNELNSIILKSSFILVPSEWYENNPMTIVEGYTMGKPVIGSKIGGIPEIILDGKTGYLFEMRNVEQLRDKIIESILLTEKEYEIMSKEARKFALYNFSEKVHYDKLIGIYNGMLT